MKLNLLLKLLAFCLPVLAHNSACAALSGTYTINAAGGATATNYVTFASAISDMVSGTRADGGPTNGPSVSGPVTFNVAAGTYSGQLTIPAITGASSTNTITFEGGAGNTNRILTHNLTSVIVLDKAKWIRIRNLTINQTGTGGVTGVLFMGTGVGALSCDNNKLEICTINMAIITGLANIQNAGIAFNVGLTGLGVGGGYYQNNRVDSCIVTGGNSSVYANGFSTTGALDNILTKNRFITSFSRSVQVTNFHGLKFTYNHMAPTVTSSSATNPVGISLTTTTASPTNFVDISFNTIYYGSIGIFMSTSSGTASLRTRISNNLVHQNSANTYAIPTAIRLSGGNSFLDVWFNSFTLTTTGSPATTSGVFVSNAAVAESSLDIRNNIFADLSNSGSVAQPFYTPTVTTFSAFNNNIFYKAGTGTLNLATYGNPSVTYTTVSAFPWGAYNANSFKVNPGFDLNPATNYLHLTSGAGQLGASIAAITSDIDGDPRAATPTVGGDEPPPPQPNDLAINAVTAPATPFNVGLQTITVTLYNNGSNTLTQATINYSVNGGTPVSEVWNGSLAPSASTSFTFTAQGTFNAGGNTIAITSSVPAGDPNTPNNSLTVTRYTNLCGNYTINATLPASSTNFQSFTAAGSALSGGVVTCAVVFTVAAGTYTQQMEIGPISGASATNTIMFDGVSSATRTLTFAASVTNSQHTIKLSGCSYVTFKDLSISNTHASLAWAVHFTGTNTSNNRFLRCNISTPNFTTYLITPIIFAAPSSITHGFTFAGIRAANNAIDTCVISGGRAGIYLNGQANDSVLTSGNKFRGNTITNAYSWCILVENAWATKILDNTLTPLTTGGGLMIYTAGSSPTDFTDVSRNAITNFGTNSAFFYNNFGGMQLYNTRGGVGGRFRVANNIVAKGIGTTNCVFIGNTTLVKDMDFVYNTLVMANTGSTQPYQGTIQIATGGGSTNNVIKNNIFAVTAASGSAIPFYDGFGTVSYTAANMSHNIFYNAANTNMARIGATTYTAANVVGGGGYNVNSQVANPNFVSANDFHVTTQGCGGGTAITGVTTDIDGQTRPAVKPTIGADEIFLLPGAAGTITGTTPVCQNQTGVVFNIPSVAGATGYTWALPSGASIGTGLNTNNVTLNFSGTATGGNITVTPTNACGNGTISPTFVLAVDPAPTVSISPATVTLCAGDSATLTASGASTYVWSPNTYLDQDSVAVVETKPASAITYNVTGTSLLGCSNTATRVVNFLPVTPLTVTPSNAVCLGLNNTLVVSGGGPTPNYSWSPTSGLTPTSGATVQATTSGTPVFYTVTGTLANGCLSSAVIPVASTPLGGVVSPATSVVCNSGSQVFNATGIAGNIQWQTSFDNINWTDVGTFPGSTSFTLTGINATTYVRALAKTVLCWDVSSTTAVVAVSATPVVTFTNVTATSATVSWTPFGATQYNLSWTGAATGSQTGATSPFTITGLTPNTNLSVTVTQSTPTCAGTTAGLGTTTTLCAKPTVSSVTAVVSPTGVKGLKVIWTAVAGATAYRVYYRPLVMNANWSSVDTAGGTTKTIMPLYAGVPYAVMVAANNCPGAGQLGQPSDVNYFTYTAPGLPACGPVPTITAVSNCPNQLTANLSGGTGTWRVTARRLSPSFSAGVSYTVSSPVVNLSITATPTGSVWEVFAQAVCGSSYSGLSNVEVVTVKAPCLAPQNVVVSHPDCDGFTVAWNPAVCGGLTLSNYQVYIKKSTAVNYVSYNGGSGDHKTFPYPALAPGTYTVFVRAITCNGSMSAASTVETGVVGGPGCKTGDEETTEATEAVVAASIYPNPTAGQFSVEVTATSKNEALRIEVADALGRVVYTDLSDTEAGLPSLRVLNLPESMSAGLYTVRIAAGQNTWTERLVLQRD